MTSEQLQAECEKRPGAARCAWNIWNPRATLAAAERQAWAAFDWDTLARLYMPVAISGGNAASAAAKEPSASTSLPKARRI